APANDRVLYSGHRYVLHGDFVVRLAVVVRLEISQIARMPVLCFRQTVLVVFRVVVAAGAHAVRRAAIAELMNVKRVLLSGSQSFEVGHDFHRLAVLREAHGAVTFIARVLGVVRRLQADLVSFPCVVGLNRSVYARSYVHGLRCSRTSHLSAALSLTNCSLAGSQFSFRPSRIEMTPRWQRATDRCPISASQTGCFLVRMQ